MLLNCGAEEDLRVPWTVRRSNQSTIKEINPEYSFDVLMLKLKLQYFGYLIQGEDSLEKTWCSQRLKAGGEGDDRGCNGWMVSLTQWSWVWTNSGSWWRIGKPDMLQSMETPRFRRDLANEQQICGDITFHFQNLAHNCMHASHQLGGSKLLAVWVRRER